MSQPIIRKAKSIVGRTLQFTDACEADAAFILRLRTHAAAARHLSSTSGALDDQVAWLRRYGTRSDEAYFIVRTLDGSPLGTVRLYDAKGMSFCWGSWIIDGEAPSSAAIESALVVYRFAINCLGFEGSHFKVNRANERVCAFHERFGATRALEREDEYEYIIDGATIRRSLERYLRFCPDPLTVEW